MVIHQKLVLRVVPPDELDLRNMHIESLEAQIKELEVDRIAYRNLGSRIEELETYIEKLEAAFLKVLRGIYLDSSTLLDEPYRQIEADKQAREALEQIRRGNDL